MTDDQYLKKPPYTIIHNYVLDVMMRELSPNAFKVLCWAIRQTYGWADDDSPTGRKESDIISYSQFMAATGIGGRSTLSRAIGECLEKKYLTREQAGTSRGRPIYSYRLNTQHRVLKQDSTTKARVPKQDAALVPKQDAYESQNGTDKSPKTGLTKERKKQRKNNDVVVLMTDFGIDPAVASKIALSRSDADVTGWLDYASGSNSQGLTDPVAFVVRRLLDGVEPPTEQQDTGHDRRRFIEGKYAEHIQH